MLCQLYASLAKRDVRAALRAAAFFGLEIGSEAEKLKHLSLAAQAQQALKLLIIMFDTRCVKHALGLRCAGARLHQARMTVSNPCDLAVAHLGC